MEMFQKVRYHPGIGTGGIYPEWGLTRVWKWGKQRQTVQV